MKTAAFATLTALTLFLALPSRLAAQRPAELDPIALSVATTAEEFLTLVDSGKYLESWEHFAPHFQSTLSEHQWEALVEQSREPLGSLRRREVQSADRTATIPGAPAGEYMIVRFRSDFEHASGVTERVTVADEGEHGWLIAGYVVDRG